MTLEEINAEKERRGWSNREFAEKLHMHEVTLSRILNGKATLTESTAAHISLLFESTRTAFLAFAVDIPKGTCEAWVPGFKDMTERQQRIAVEAVVQKAVTLLAAKGKELMTAEDSAQARTVLPGAETTGPAPIIRAHRPAARPME